MFTVFPRPERIIIGSDRTAMLLFLQMFRVQTSSYNEIYK